MCYNGESWQRLNDYNRCVCAAGFFGKNCKHSDWKGTSFLVVFLGGLIGNLIPKLLVASDITARLSVFYFNNTNNQSIIIDETNTEKYLNNSVFPSDVIHSAGLEVHSDVRVNMYGLLYDGLYSEGFLLMPVRFASTEHIIPTLPYGYGKIFAVTAVNQNTVILIDLKLQSGSITYDNKQYGNKDTLRFVMNRYHTFQLSHTSDLSGTIVTSSKPVIVVSGNSCSRAVGYNHAGGCQSFIESVLPTNQHDNLFITPHVATRLNNTVRLQSVHNTSLTIKIGNEKKSLSLMARDSLDFYYNTISLISPSDDILVMSYPHGLPKHKGDPFMMTIPGVNQYLYEYDFVVPTGFDSYISITVQSDAIDGFLLDRNPFNIRSVFSISEGLYQFTTFSMSISTGFHHIEHSRTVRFGLWINGNGDIDGYGYPAGMAYKIFD
ncbi:IgGFc-binding protein-like [Mytilus edulis]|uniref:IgGFc-binding protein-like n=1 Tax=Mytilus edulis TaxID=6550 RepID=UPI0039EEA636